MSAFHPYPGPEPVNPAAPEPLSVLPLRPRVALPLLLILPALAAGTITVLRVRAPAVTVTRGAGVTTYLVDRPFLATSAGLLGLALGLCVVALVVRPHPRLRMFAAVVLVVSVGLGQVLYHHLHARADLTIDTLVAPGRAHGILPVDPVSVRLDGLIQFDFVGSPAENRKHFQRAYTTPKQFADLDLGPLYDAAHGDVKAALEAHHVPVRED